MNKFVFIAVNCLLLFGCASTVLADKDLGTFSGTGGYLPTNLTDTGTGADGVKGASDILSAIFTNSIGFITIVAGIFFLFHFLTGAMSWITAGGESQKLEDARRKMTNGAIGMAIIIGSYSVIYIIGQVLGFDILKIGDQIAKIGPDGGN